MAEHALDFRKLVTSHNYNGRTPYKVQTDTILTMVSNHRAYVLNGMGTGKTFCTLAAFDILRKAGLARKMLVAAPLSTLRFVWAAEVLKSFPHLTVEILHGTKAKRMEALARDADIYVINHDGIEVVKDDLLWRKYIDVLTIDELAVYRNGGAKRTKTMRDVAKTKKYAWGLTGSPMPRDVTDIWGQCSILTPHTVPKYFNHLRQQLCYKAGPYEWAPKPGAVEQAVKMMSPSVRYSLDDVLELPEQFMVYQPTDMGLRQGELYQQMKRRAVALWGDQKIDALNAGATLSKLLQIALGWVYTREGKTVALDNHARVAAIIDAINSTPNKALVFLPYKNALEGVGEALAKAGITFKVVSGDTPARERGVIFDEFQNTSEPRVLLAHPACLAHGLTLTVADTIIWGGPVTSLETFQQACARIRRIGQKKKQYIIMLGGTPVEKRMYSLLGDNEKLQNHFLGLLADATI